MSPIKRKTRLGFFLKSFLLFFFSFILTRQPVAAEEFFSTELAVVYSISPLGEVEVQQEISLKNLTSDRYATSYHLDLTGNIKNVVAWDETGPLEPVVSLEAKTHSIKVNLHRPALGEGAIKRFSISYSITDFVEKNGKIWEVHLPPIPDIDQLSKVTLTLAVPYEIGPLAYITPEPTSTSSSNQQRFYTFDEKSLSSQGVNAAFGECQVFDFELRYHLINTYNTKGITTISLPPDTPYQRVFYEQISPAPETTWFDLDGNLIAQYRLKSKEKIDIVAIGKAVLHAAPLTSWPGTDEETLAKNLLPQTYWETEHPQIIELAQELKTPEAIFNYTVSTLTYDDTIADDQINRRGALGALANADHALCMEFTDLFITLCRAAGVPAREVVGFAFTNRVDLKPAQNTIDILHSWPEYWNKTEQRWIPVDPTWENTTQGRDYFHKLDLNHFVFTYHGLDSQQPVPAGSYKTGQETDKDIQISFGKLSEIERFPLEITWSLPLAFFKSLTASVSIFNPGPQTLYNLELGIETQEINLAPDFSVPATILALAPFETKKIPVKLERPRVWQFGMAKLSLEINNELFSYEFRIEQATWPRLIMFSLLIFVFALLIFLHTTRKKRKVAKEG
ncbi:transglutaminase domain-containing protein [Patescibacteria group bacterium]|nr:transglutaminase domain-containing protein [Patescibacteria group bacterium]